MPRKTPGTSREDLCEGRDDLPVGRGEPVSGLRRSARPVYPASLESATTPVRNWNRSRACSTSAGPQTHTPTAAVFARTERRCNFNVRRPPACAAGSVFGGAAAHLCAADHRSCLFAHTRKRICRYNCFQIILHACDTRPNGLVFLVGAASDIAWSQPVPLLLLL